MRKIELNAYAKINLGLDVLRKREDGYHEVKMIMQTVDLYDVLKMETIEEDKIELKTNISSLETDESNLVYKAIKLMKTEYNIQTGIRAELTKNIPIAAGMAGGSTDCAAAIKGMNQLFDLNLTEDKLRELGKRLGADVPYCIMGGTALAEGIGEILTPLKSIKGDYIVIAKPNISVSTKYVYDNLNLQERDNHPNIDYLIECIENDNKRELFSNMGNILESVTANKYGIINEIKKTLLEAGAINTLMSGSGPTVFAIFENAETAHLACNKVKELYTLDKAIVTTLY